MDYSLIALDVDGTLLNDNYEMTDITKRALREAHGTGASLVLCTGRGPANAVPILEQLGLEGVLITHNGAATIQTPGPVLLQEHAFSLSQIEALIRYCRKHSIHFDVNTAFDVFLETIGSAEAIMYEKYLQTPKQIADVLSLEGPVVKLTMFGPSSVMDAVERELPTMPLADGIRWFRSSAEFIDVMSGAVSKGNALAKLAEQWNIPRPRVLAMGNYYNDIEMLEYAGLGIAMGNSPDAVKEAADDVTLSNNENGVYAALLKHGMVSGSWS
ncbi:Cof-type HAD-IIB family hydrolase [Paenibacillus xerothermodurans]|uniref:Cof-type HAD-IIB family hydrolase n=1 Tax=Paenibacillus xerothermodurans TaxID=1977292 RepID=A0A2W1NQM5_PAEXE|nr:Cof-type HAD-IIB family hydrolase [Paenibacillus xerothermodurans]